MSRILITGGAGFIGLGVARTLAARGDEVIAFDIARSPRLDAALAQHRNIEFIQGEITEWPQVVALMQSRKPDAVVHCAAIVGVTNSLASPARKRLTATSRRTGSTRLIRTAQEGNPS